MKLTLGFSPCPNDTFIFDALVNGKIDTEDIAFEVVLEDVETLNRWAGEAKLDITKLSFPALFQNLTAYGLLSCGAALGQGVGPLLIANGPVDMTHLKTLRIAIPGLNTTANFLLTHAFPEAQQRVPMLFSEIEGAVLRQEVDLGVIIHENRFTYQQKGLVKICDLGEVWEQKQHAPIPLGGIAARRSLPTSVHQKVESLIRQSLTYSFNHYPELSIYVSQHAQEMSEAVMRQHIELYVNNYTMDLGEQGMAAVAKLHEVYRLQTGQHPEQAGSLFALT